MFIKIYKPNKVIIYGSTTKGQRKQFVVETTKQQFILWFEIYWNKCCIGSSNTKVCKRLGNFNWLPLYYFFYFFYIDFLITIKNEMYSNILCFNVIKYIIIHFKDVPFEFYAQRRTCNVVNM